MVGSAADGTWATGSNWGGWTTATSGVVDNGTSVEYTFSAGDPKRFARLHVTITP